MKFSAVVEQVLDMLQRQGRVSYRALKREFELDDDLLADLKEELLYAHAQEVQEEGPGLVWVGGAAKEETENRGNGESGREQTTASDARPPTLDPRLTAGERRQLTVQFIDLVGSTTLSQQLDPEDYHARVVAYQAACRQVIERYDGHIAQYLGDGVLVYFGYPVAHDEDAVRAIRSSLDIVAAVGQLEYTPPLQVRIGIHTGPVVVGEIGAGERTERLALGETPNIAARVQGQAAPNTVVISAATHRLVEGLFACRELGPQALKGISTPMALYRVVGESATPSRFEAAVHKGLTPLVGRAEELTLLQRRWEHAKAGAGQVVLLSGEPGIGKSRLVQELKEQFEHEGVTRIEFRCSPYHQNSALYPILDHLQRLLQFAREDAPAVKLEKLQRTLSHYHFPQVDTAPLLAALLSLPHPEDAPPLTLSPQKQKQKTQEALVAWIVEEAEKGAVYCVWEDLHWADPSTLEVLTLFLDQVPTTRLLALLTFRPEFLPPWGNRSHLTQLTLSRLGRSQVEAMVERVTGGKALPPEVMQQIVAKTDGVPLFVEELTKTVVETMREQATGNGGQDEKIVGVQHAAPVSALGVPSTLQDALMARLDRLGPTKEIAQLGATLGREFSYELLQAVSLLDEETLQHGLKQLVKVELLYQRGLPPQAHYLFKHALIQDTAYQSLLKSTRQQYHRQIAQVLEARFPETKETQPELLAHHYTEVNLTARAIPYWQQAGQRATQRSAYVEAISHLTKGLELLKALPDTPERAQQELFLQTALGSAFMATKGFAAPEVESAFSRARELCRQVGEPPQLFPVLRGLAAFYLVRADYKTTQELGEQCLRLAQRLQDPLLLVGARLERGGTLFSLGEFAQALEHLEQGIALYDPQKHRSHAFLHGQDLGVSCLSRTPPVLWMLGYPDQALKKSQEAIASAQELSHPPTFAYALSFAAECHRLRREGQAAQEQAEAALALSIDQGFAIWVAGATLLRGWALAEQGQVEEGIAQMRQGLAAWQATGAEMARPQFLGMLAETYGKEGQAEEGLTLLAEALAVVHKTGERWYEAELYRLYGELSLRIGETETGRTGDAENETENRRAGATGNRRERFSFTDSPIRRFADSFAEFPDSSPEACFKKAIKIARKQQAKSLELRAAMSLARLWQQQGKRHAAHNMLSEIYNWFTEGFDTKDLQEARVLIEELVG